MIALVERKTMGRLGADPSAPVVVSRRSSLEKQPWRDAEGIQNQVEAKFLRPVLLGESILPYRLFQSFEGVVPVDEDGTALNASTAARRGYEKVSGWLASGEKLWSELSTNQEMSLIDRFDYHKELSSQFPLSPMRLVYAKAGALPAACIIRDDRAVIDHMLYWSKPASEDEAYYLCAILNSETARSRAAQYQARGQFGARHFDKVMFNLPIPLFKAGNALHAELAQAGAQAEAVAASVELKEGEKFQRARKRVRDALAEDGIGGEIEKLVEKLLGPV
jgi:hypothetical protein